MIKYEESAEIRTVSGWGCKKCNRFYGKDEHSARCCCAGDLPCDCGARRKKYQVRCSACQEQKEEQAWHNMPEKEWDGITPVVIGDDYFFDPESLLDFLSENDLDVEMAKIEHCKPNKARSFSIIDHLSDVLPDQDIELEGAKALEDQVNNWIQSKAPFSWSRAGVRVSEKSLAAIQEELVKIRIDPDGEK